MRIDDQLIISSGTALHSVIIARNDSIYHTFTILQNGTAMFTQIKILIK
jgi:hypothetical protein